MTLRRTVHTIVLTAALFVGAAAAPSVAEASPRALSVHSVAVIGRDPLAVTANDALTAWSAYSATGNAKSLADYVSLRDALATEAANRLAIDPNRMIAAWTEADTSHQLVLVAAFTQLGTPYHHNTSKPGVGFDCSGFTTFAWAQVGVPLARVSRSQIRAAAPRTIDTAQAGDLAYYPGHVMLYLGVDDAIVHAPQSGRSVEVDFITKRRVRSTKFGNPLGG
jgi:cell wall-associated NlpC family hydrolase